MKVVNPFTYKPMFAEPDTDSQTVSGQAFTLEELLQRYARGMTLTENGNLLYDGDDDPDSLDFDEDDDITQHPDVDLVDIYDEAERLSERHKSRGRDSSVRDDKGEPSSPDTDSGNSDSAGEGDSSRFEKKDRTTSTSAES